MEVDNEALKIFTDKLSDILTAMTEHDFKKSASHCICAPNDNSARSYVMLVIFPYRTCTPTFFHNLKTTVI